MIAYTGFQDISDRESGIQSLLAMIERKAPVMMRCSLGGIVSEMQSQDHRMTDHDRKQIRMLYARGKELREIATMTKWSITSVRRVALNEKRRS